MTPKASPNKARINHNSSSDAIEHEKTGLICDGNSLDDIYSSINLMLENKKYLEYGKAAKNNVSKFYWPNIIEEYKKILN